MPYRPYGEHFAFPLSEVGARGGVLAGSGCHKKNTTDSVAQTTGIYFSQSGGWKVQDEGAGRFGVSGEQSLKDRYVSHVCLT